MTEIAESTKPVSFYKAPILQVQEVQKSGKEKRRERRKKQRKTNNK